MTLAHCSDDIDSGKGNGSSVDENGVAMVSIVIEVATNPRWW